MNESFPKMGSEISTPNGKVNVESTLPVEKEPAAIDTPTTNETIPGPSTPEWPECNPLYMEKRLVAKLVGDLDHCMIFRKN